MNEDRFTKIMSFIVIAAIVVFVLTSCTTAQRDAALQGSAMAGQLAVADRMLQSGEVERTVLSVPVTEVQYDMLTRAFAQYEQSREVLREILDDPGQLADASVLIRAEHERLTDAYLSVQDVVRANWDEYGPVEQARLDRWAGQAARLNQSYHRLVTMIADAATETERTQRIVELARIVGQIALMAI